MKDARRRGCLVVGLLWFALFAFTWLATTMGDCVGEGCETRRATLKHWLVFGELALLVGIAWFFYRRVMKDGDF